MFLKHQSTMRVKSNTNSDDFTSNADLIDKQVDKIDSPEHFDEVNEETESNGSEEHNGAAIGLHSSSPGFLNEAVTMTEKNVMEMEHKFQSYLASYDLLGQKEAFILQAKLSFVITRSDTWKRQHYDDDVIDKGLNKITLLNVKDLEFYQNGFPTTLRQLSRFNEDDSHRNIFQQQTILHPVNVLVRQGVFL